KADDVTGGVNIRHGSAVVGVHGKITAIVDGQTGFFQREAIHRRAAARGKECGFGLQDFSAFHGEIHTAGSSLHFYGALVEPELHAQRRESFTKPLGNFRIEERKQAIASVDQRDANAESHEDGRVFATDHSSTDDRETSW